MAQNLTLIVTYAALTAETVAAIEAWSRLVPDTWVCRVAGSENTDVAPPGHWQRLPDQADAAGVGQVAVGAGHGAWLLLVNAHDAAEPVGWSRLLKLLPELDPQTIYLLPVTLGAHFADVQPRLLHRTGLIEGAPANPAADLGLQMSLLPVWPLQMNAESGWTGLHAPDPLSDALVRDSGLDTLPWPQPDQADLSYALRLLIADHYRVRGDFHEARCWLEPAEASGPPAIRVGLGLIDLAEERPGEALVQFSHGWRAESLVRWPGYYPRDVIDRHYLGLVIAEAYRRLGVRWAAELFTRMAEGGDRPRQDRLLVSTLGEQAERHAWDEVMTVLAYHFDWHERADAWRDQFALGGSEQDLAKAEIWHALETAGLKGNHAVPLWKRVTRAEAADPRAWQQLASHALVAQRWAEAARYLQEAIGRDPEIGWVWNSLGVAQVRQGQLFEAEKSFRQALAVPQPEPSATRNLQELERLMARQLRQ